MTTFDAREQAFENKFAQDTAVAFQIHAHAVKTLAQGIAQELGKSADEAAAYVQATLAHEIQNAQMSPVIAKFAADLEAAGKPHTMEHLTERWQSTLAKARAAVLPRDQL